MQKYSIKKLVRKIIEVFKEMEIEIILVNDDSPDNSHQECLEIFDENKLKVNYIKLSKNVGEHNAYGWSSLCCGRLVLIMDDDFQNPPEEGLKLVICFEKRLRYCLW